jgi:XTP/dITP diphosphohydrolase
MTESRTILIATGNPGKQREIVAIVSVALAGLAERIDWLSLRDLPACPPEPEETGETFAANARLKALYYARASGHWTLADDSGLEVDALGGAPGVRSARFAGKPEGTPRTEADAANNLVLIERLRAGDVADADRTARFRCARALAGTYTIVDQASGGASDGDATDRAPRILLEAEGTIEGRIIDTPRGANGFGYDPHFFVDSHGCTTAEMPTDEKNRISHRGRAVRALAGALGPLLARGF